MMWIRSAVFNAFFVVLTALVLLTYWPLRLFPRRYMRKTIRLWGIGVRAGLKGLVGLDFEIRGRQNIPPGPAIFASKHQSACDTAFFGLIADKPAYILKEELLSIPLWGAYARRCGAIIVNRAGGASALKKMVRDSEAAIDRGHTVIIFPEGTRTAPGQVLPYQPGIAALYARTSAPVVPVALNSGLFWPRRGFVKRPGTIVVEFLPALPPGLDRRAFMAELESRIETATDRLATEAGNTLER